MKGEELTVLEQTTQLKEQLYAQMISNPAFTERNIETANTHLLDSSIMYHTLQTLCACVWLVNTLTSTAPIGSLMHFDPQPIFANNGKGIYLLVQQTFMGQERVTNP